MKRKASPCRLSLFCVAYWMAMGLTYVTPALAQEIKLRYNLDRVRIGLMSHEVIRGKITAFTPDSLALEDKFLAPPGSIVYISFVNSNQGMKCEIIKINDNEMLVAKPGESETYRYRRKDLAEFRVVRTSLSPEALTKYQNRWIPAATVNYIALHKKGAGAIGGVVGAAAGAALLYGLT